MAPFIYMGFERACVIGDRVWLSEWDIADITFTLARHVTRFDDVDPVYCVSEHILQHARNIIQEHTGYDFLNDYNGLGSKIHMHWKSIYSRFDYSQDAVNELTEALEVLPQEKCQSIKHNQICSYFLKELGISEQHWWQ